MEIKVITVPEKSESKDESFKIEKLVEDRNNIIAKRFNVEPKNVIVKLYRSKGQLATVLDPNGEHLGVFAGYVDGSDEILLAHPENISPIFGENLGKEMSILTDYSLTKFYFCKKYYPTRMDFKLYYKYLSEILGQISAGNFNAPIAKFDIKMYSEDKRYKKEQEVGMLFYIMREKSKLDFIYENLDKFVTDCDVKKTCFTIYKKSFSEIIKQMQKEILEEEKKLAATFKPGRR